MIKRTITLENSFGFEAGGSVEGLNIAFHASKPEWNGTDKVIWICHALTANSDPSDWWPGMVGEGKFFDTNEYFIVCVNILGSPYGTTGPSSVNPASGKPYFFSFPKVTVRDMVKAQNIVREYLGLDHIDFLVGASIGGFQAAEWAVTYPEIIRNLALVATDIRVSPWLTAWVEAQKMALRADQTFEKCESLDGGKEGLKCARAQALISYRSYDGYCLTQAEESQDTLFADRAASYERYQGEKLANRFDAYSYLSLCDSLNSHNIGRGRGGVDAALSRITASTTVVGIDSDYLFPTKTMKEWHSKISGAKYATIGSAFGHDGFLLENEQLTNIFKEIICKS